MFVIALLVIVGLAAIVYLLGAAWRLLEAIVQGVVGGVIYTVAILSGAWELLCAFGRWIRATDERIGQRAHAAYWSYSYWLKRAYIASRLRAWRKEKRL